MTTELNFYLTGITEERAILLLSKASGVPEEFIEKLKAPILPEQLTTDEIEQLTKLAETLEVSILDFLSAKDQATFITRVIEIERQYRIIERIGGIDPRWMMNRDDRGGTEPIPEPSFFHCIPYWTCVTSGEGNCGTRPRGC